MKIAEEGTIEILIDYMGNSENDIVARQYCAMCLGNLFSPLPPSPLPSRNCYALI